MLDAYLIFGISTCFYVSDSLVEDTHDAMGYTGVYVAFCISDVGVRAVCDRRDVVRHNAGRASGVKYKYKYKIYL